MQKVYMSNLKKGFKDNNEGKKVMKSGLFLSTMIGSEAQQTADLFGDWHRTLALSAGEMSELARGMGNVALSTGVTGDELLGAMKSSEEILKNFRNQKNLTADVAKSVIEIMAESNKAGFGESAKKYLTAMSSYSSMMNADSKTKSLLFTVSNRMGGNASRQMMMGNFPKDRENLAGFSKELQNTVAGWVGKSGKDFDFDNITEKEKEILALTAQRYDIEIAELENLIKTTKQAGKGLAGTVEGLREIQSSEFSTEAEKKIAAEQESQRYLSSSLDYLSAIGDVAKKKGLSGALADSATSSDFKDKRQDFTAMAGALTDEMKAAYGIGGTDEQMKQQLAGLDPQKVIELQALVAGDKLNKLANEQGITLDKDYSNEMLKAFAQKDSAKYRELSGEMGDKFKEISVKKQASTSPEEKLALRINELNETIRAYTSSFVRGMVDYMGMMGLLLINLSLIGTALAMTVGPGLLNLTGIMGGLFPKGGFKGLFGGGAKGGLDNLASTIAKSDSVKDGMFKRFFKTYTNSKNPSRVMDIAEYRKFRRQGLSPMDSKKAVEKMGGFAKGKGTFKSLLDATDELGDTLKGKIVNGVDDFGKKGSKMFNRLGTRVNLFGTQLKNSFSSAIDAFKVARKGTLGTGAFGRGGAAGKGIFGSIIDASDTFFDTFSPTKTKPLNKLLDKFKNSKIYKSASSSFETINKAIKAGKASFVDYGKRLDFMGKTGKISKTFSSLKVGIDSFFSSLTGGMRPLNKIASIFRKIKSAFSLENLTKLPSLLTKLPSLLMGLPSTFLKMFKTIPKIFSGGVGGILKGVGKGFRGGMGLASKGLKAAILGGTAGTAQIIFSAIDMVFGAVSGFTNTGKRFEGVMKAMGKSTKDMTWGMYASSTVAGALVGILDGLTFGMLGLFGVTESLNQIFSLVFYTFFSFIEGIIEGIMVPFEAVWSAFKYIGDQFKSIGDSLLGVFNSIAGLFGPEAGNWSEAFAMIYPWLKAIGKVIGMVIGMPIAGFLWLVVKAISALLVPVQMFINAIAGVIKVFRGVIDFFSDIFKGNIRKAFRNLGSVVGSAIYGVFKPIIDFLWSIGADLFAPIEKFFGGIPKGIYDWIYKAAGKVGAQWLLDMLFGKKGSAGADASKGKAEAAASNPGSAGAVRQAPTQQVEARTGRSLEQATAAAYGAPTARRAVRRPGGGPVSANYAASSASYSMERASASAATPVGHHAVPFARPNQGGEVGDVQPVHLRDISDSILRDRAGSSGTGKVQSDELSRIEEASFRQVEELEQIKQGITEMVSLLKPKGSGMVGGSGETGSGNTRDPRRPLHAAKFGKMKYGKVGGNANRSLVNNGES
jgi:hypothetical protein